MTEERQRALSFSFGIYRVLIYSESQFLSVYHLGHQQLLLCTLCNRCTIFANTFGCLKVFQFYYNLYLKIIMTDPQPGPKKDLIVGSLLLYSSNQPQQSYSLAVWYRILPECKKIVKLQTVKFNTSICYRPTFFDIDSEIQVKLEGKENDDCKVFGPIKIDQYLHRQIDESKNQNCFFNVNVHTKLTQTMSMKIKIVIMEENQGLLLHLIGGKKQKQLCFKIPYKQNWRNYEEIFENSDLKLTDILIRHLEGQENFKEKLRGIGIEKNHLLLTFGNVVQKNLFLAQIMRKSKGKLENETKSISILENKIQNEVDDLFRSNISQANLIKNSVVFDKMCNQMFDVLFTPHSNLEENDAQNAYSVSNFEKFLNPEKKLAEKLSDIEEEPEIPEKSILYGQSKQVLLSTKKINPIITNSSKLGSQTQLHSDVDQLMFQKNYLAEENQKLKRQNKILKKKLQFKTRKQIVYQIPLDIRKSLRQLSESRSKITKNSTNHPSKMASKREKTQEAETSQFLKSEKRESKSSVKLIIQHKTPSSKKMFCEDFEQKLLSSTMSKTITTSSKSIKCFKRTGSISCQ